MIVLDTNVLSELMRPRPDRGVIDWVESHSSPSLYTTSITVAEIFHGILLLPEGTRRDSLTAAAEGMFDEDLRGRILSFDTSAARAFAEIVTERRRSGRPISHEDAQIAAITRSSKARLATRNVADFQGCGVALLDPWSA
jgi:toxin FitB